MQVLAQAPWRGNIRELQHTIERMVVTSTGPQLTPRAFSGAPRFSSNTSAESDLLSVARNAVQTAERTRILEALEQASGNRVLAARLLKISRANLYNKLRAYRIE
jgi:two-component system response regulator AtoC